MLGKAAKLITKAKEEKAEILKVVDGLPLPEQLKYAAHNPKSLLSKSAQNKLETVERDLEKALPVKKISADTIESTPQISPEALQILQQYANTLGIKLPLPNQTVEKVTDQIVQPQVEQEEEEEQAQEQEQKQEPEPKPKPKPVEERPPISSPQAEWAAARKARATPGSRATQAKKAIIEVNETELAEIKLILANKKKAFNVV